MRGPSKSLTEAGVIIVSIIAIIVTTISTVTIVSISNIVTIFSIVRSNVHYLCKIRGQIDAS